MMKKLFVLLMAVLLFAGIAVPAAAEGYDAYFYTFDGSYKESAPVYVPKTVLKLTDNLGYAAKDPRDIYATDDGMLYVLDTANNRILVYDGNNNYEYVSSIASFVNPNVEGGSDTFNAPAGIHVLNDGTIYVADTGNSRVVVLDPEGTCTMTIQNPKGTGITEGFIYQPSSIAVDVMGNIYTVSSSSNMGLLVFNAKGEFQSFLGAQTVTLSASEIFWRVFQTAAQKAQQAKSLPANYDSVSIDDKGFLYVTSAKIDAQKQYSAMVAKSIASDYAPIKKLNPSGKDVLTRAGFYPPAGDLALSEGVGDIATRVSRFVDCEVNALGIYTAIETTNNHIFTYSADGSLLCAFGGQGNALGRFSTVTAVAYCNDDLLVLDKNNASVTVFSLSDFGKELFTALQLQSDRQYGAALEKFEKLLPLNANMDFIYVNMGKSYMKNGEYDKAMEYFRAVNDKENYSDAYKLSREDGLNKIAIFIPIVAIALVWLISWVLGKIAKLNKKDDMESQRVDNLWHQILYAFRLLTNPLDGAYELKRSHRGSVKGASIILAIASAVMVFKAYASGYIFVAGDKSEVNPIVVVLGIVLPVLVFCAGNWCVTSLMYGNGELRDIYCVACYSLLPLILFLVPTTILTNFLTLSEGQILSFVEGLAYVWTVALIFLGILTIHSYSFFKNIVAIILSLVAMIVIVFLALLVVILTVRVYSFFDTIVTELLYRI